VQNEARLGTRERRRDELDQARSGGRRGRIARGAASKKDAPHVERASVEVVLPGPVARSETGGLGGVETGVSIKGIADLARHQEKG
jgi:hypothetical protein